MRTELSEWADVDPNAEEVGFAYGVRVSVGDGNPMHYAEGGAVYTTKDIDEAEAKRIEVRDRIKDGAGYQSFSVRGYRKMNALVFDRCATETPEHADGC